MKKIDTLIRLGRTQAARIEVERLLRRRVPRSFALQIASLARRCRCPHWGIRVLNPIVRSKNQSRTQPTTSERAEYAVCLSKIGATGEALSILSNLSGEKNPEVYLFHGMALAGEWEYADAISYFEKYTASAELDSYARLVGEANLAAALIFEKQNHRAASLLENLLGQTQAPNHGLLHGNVLELCAQNALAMGEYGDADRWLTRAANVLGKTHDLTEYFLQKWRAVLTLLSNGANPSSLKEIEVARKQALKMRHWESVRDLDRFAAMSTRDTGLIQHIYFGTPFVNFRKKLLQDYHEDVPIPQEYVWNLSQSEPSSKAPVLNLFRGEVNGYSKGLKVGQVIHRLLATLCTDFYRPFRMATLYDKLFGGEYYNPQTSPPRVHQTLKRLRQWFKKMELPLEIGENDGQYHLYATSAFGIQVKLQSPLGKESKVVSLQIVKEALEKTDFSAQEVMNLLKVSRNSACRIINIAKKKGQLQLVGSGPKTRYRFVA